MTFSKDLDFSWWALRIGLGLTAFLAGLDKFFNLLTNWSMYLSPLVMNFVPASGRTIMFFVGPVEMLVGLAILTRWTRIGAYVASAWLFSIALSLVSTGGFFDIAVRDVVLSIAAFVLGNMTGARESFRSAHRSEPRFRFEPSRQVDAA